MSLLLHILTISTNYQIVGSALSRRIIIAYLRLCRAIIYHTCSCLLVLQDECPCGGCGGVRDDDLATIRDSEIYAKNK